MGTENFLVTCHAACHESRLSVTSHVLCLLKILCLSGCWPGWVTSAGVTVSGCPPVSPACELSAVSALSSQHGIISHSVPSAVKVHKNRMKSSLVAPLANVRRMYIAALLGVSGSRSRHCVAADRWDQPLTWPTAAHTNDMQQVHNVSEG